MLRELLRSAPLAAALLVAGLTGVEAGAAESGYLFVKSEPSGARIWIDGLQTTDSTPHLIGDIAPGEHVVMVRHPGKGFARKEVNVTAGQIVTVALQLSAGGLPGTLQISTNPAGATIWVDTKEMGNAPLTVPELKAGSHTIVAMVEGYELVEMEVSVDPGATRPVAIELVKQGGAPATPAVAEPAGEGQPAGGAEGITTTTTTPDPAAATEEVAKYIDADCPYCKGSGTISEIGCFKCLGKGTINHRPCRSCGGDGRAPYQCPGCKGAGSDARGRECRYCRGRGAPLCVACRGKGTVKRPNPKAAGYPTRSCIICDGSGYDMHQKCIVCAGDGSIRSGLWGMGSECKVCGGDGKGPPVCRVCRGKGYTGKPPAHALCGQCRGAGFVYVHCRTCSGRGFIRDR